MPSQFHLLAERRFLPFFLTQFLGAFNDNVYKNALVVLITFQAAQLGAASPGVMVNLAAGLFILPFFLFSATAGQLADKYEKSRLIRYTKLLEVAVMALAAVGFAHMSLPLLLLVLFLMGAQSALFGPVKYAIIPQQLADGELMGGNALVEAATFVAILAGTLLGGLLVAGAGGPERVSVAVIALALLGWAASVRIPPAAAADPSLTVNWNPLTQTRDMIRFTLESRAVLMAIVGISWFWFYGALFLSQFPGFAADHLGGDERLVTLLLALFSVGIGAGSLLCGRLSAGRVEPRLVPLGALGLTLFAVDLWWASPAAGALGAGQPLAVLLAREDVWRIVFDLVMIGVSGGFFIVPLYALMQQRSASAHRARIVAGNNILNALFMVAAAAMGAGLLATGLAVPQLFLVTALLNVLVAGLLFTLEPVFRQRGGFP
ncbi:MFS transporter [Thauera sp.]|jgi:MFS family permease|uniref:MFS transporter n=1 Tax=Thauera sp. TaxID=1905334 RepID=UPI002604E036|nr:MFS transporter [Thauera sp.]